MTTKIKYLFQKKKKKKNHRLQKGQNLQKYAF